jgi:hypothetical protein
MDGNYLVGCEAQDAADAVEQDSDAGGSLAEHGEAGGDPGW